MSTRIHSPAFITVDGLTLNAVADDGATWVFDEIKGWPDGPGVNVEQVQRIVAHGEFAQAGHRSGRLITVEGTVFSDLRGPVASAAELLPTVLADGGFGEFAFSDDDTGVKTAQVQLFGAPSIDWQGALFFRYQLQLLAPDSYRYGATSSASTGFAAPAAGSGLVFPLFPDGVLDFGPLGDLGAVSVSNFGSASATVRFSITGPTPVGGFSITDTTTGKRITFLGAIPAGSALVMDGGSGSVVIDGTADRLGDTIVEAWPSVPKRDERSFLFEPIGSPTAAVLTATCVSTYW